MPNAAFKELAVERVDDIEGSGAQISFSQSAHQLVHKIQRVIKRFHQDTLIAAVSADVVFVGEDAADAISRGCPAILRYFPSVAPVPMPGMIGVPGQIDAATAVRSATTFGSSVETGLILAAPIGEILICGSARTSLSVRSTSAGMSFGRMRQLTTAIAD